LTGFSRELAVPRRSKVNQDRLRGMELENMMGE
jgi:hypothetical protein